MPERTLVLLKPDAVERGLMGEIISRFERRGMRIAAMKMLRMDEELVARLYAEHVGQDFYPRLRRFSLSGPLAALVVEAEGAIEGVRAMMGATDPAQAAPGSIRGDYGLVRPANLVHGSDSPASAAREIPIFFSEDEIMS